MEDDKVACKSCGQMNAKDATFCAFCGGRTDGQTVCSACGTVHEGKFCPNCGHAEGAAPAPQAAPAPAPAAAPAAPVYAAPAPVAPAPVYAPVAAKAPMNTLQKILSIVGSAVLMLGVLFAFIALFGIGVDMTYESAMMEAFGATDTMKLEMSGLFYYFSDYKYAAYGIVTEEQKAIVEAAGGLSMYLSYMEYPGEMVTAITMTQIFGVGISLATAALVISFAIPALINFIKCLTGKENNFAKWGVLTIVMFFMGSGMLYALNVYAMEEVVNNVTAEAYHYGFNGITKTAIVLGCIGIGVFASTKLFASWKSWLNVKGILRVSFAVVAVIALAFVFSGAKAAAVTVTESANEMGMSASSTETMSFFKMVISGDYNYVIISGTDPSTGQTISQVMTDAEYEALMSAGFGSYGDVEYIGDTILIYGIFAHMMAIVVAVLSAVALGKAIKNVYSEQKSSNLGISIVLLIFTAIYAVFAFMVQSQVTRLFEAQAGSSAAAIAPILPEVSITPIILAAVFAVINLGMAIAQKVVSPKPVAPVAPYGYAPVYAAPQNYNNNNMSFGG
jgi:hypothetical protein